MNEINMNRLLPAAFGALLLLIVSATAAHAQVHTIEIKDGRVTVDGREMAGESLPASFDPAGIDAQFRLDADSYAFFQVDGRMYRVGAEGIEEIEDAADGVVLRAERQRMRSSNAPVLFAADAAPARRSSEAEMSFIANQAEVLHERARELQRLTLELQQTRMQSNQLFDMIESIQRSAAETEQVARSLPHLQTQRYMQEMRERNNDLYEQLLREQSLERETVELSQRIQTMIEGEERDALIDRLRSRLEENFEMKQENRRREIAELEERLSSLQRRLEKRERYHDYIIEKRLNELIGNEEEQD